MNKLGQARTTKYPSLFTLVSTSIHTRFNCYLLLVVVSVAAHPTSMSSTRGGILGWNIENYSTHTERSVLRAYVINIFIPCYVTLNIRDWSISVN